MQQENFASSKDLDIYTHTLTHYFTFPHILSVITLSSKSNCLIPTNSIAKLHNKATTLNLFGLRIPSWARFRLINSTTKRPLLTNSIHPRDVFRLISYNDCRSSRDLDLDLRQKDTCSQTTQVLAIFTLMTRNPTTRASLSGPILPRAPHINTIITTKIHGSRKLHAIPTMN